MCATGTIATPTTTAILKHLVGRLPIIVSTAFMDDESTQPEASFDHSSMLSANITTVLEAVDYDFQFRSRRIAGRVDHAAIYSAKPSTPDYVAIHDGVYVDAALSGIDLTDLYSRVRVTFRDASGRDAHVDVIDTDPAHPLVNLGIVKWKVLACAATNVSDATAVGTRYLVDAGRAQVVGTLTLTGEIATVNGAPVRPCDVQSGRIVRIHGTSRGQVDARILEARKTNTTKVECSLDNTPDIARAIARLLASRGVGV